MKKSANIVVNGNRMNIVPPKIRNKTKMSSLSHHCYSALYWKFQPVQQGKKKKQKASGFEREKVKLSLFTDDMIISVENLIELKKVAEYKINI